MSAPEVILRIAPNGDVELMPCGFASEAAGLAATLPYRAVFPGGMLIMQRAFARGRSALAQAARAFRAEVQAWRTLPVIECEYLNDPDRTLALYEALWKLTGGAP